MRKGLIHLYIGDGKGKTTAALGLLLRAYGSGMRTVLVQFLKGRKTGEIRALAQLAGVTVLRNSRDFGFYSSASDQDRAEMRCQNNENLLKARCLVASGLCQLLVLDEIGVAYAQGALDTEIADKLILNKPAGLELVLTGRSVPDHFIEVADYITKFIKCKHPHDRGIAAREGIEF